MHALLKEIEAIPTLTRFGRVARIEGLAVEVTGRCRGRQPGRPGPPKPSETTRKFPAKWSAFATAAPW